MRRNVGTWALAVALATVSAGTAAAIEPVDSGAFIAGFGAGQIVPHLKALDRIAKANGGDRATGTGGYRASREYVAERLTAAGYAVETQKLSAFVFQERIFPIMERLSPTPTKYAHSDHFRTMEFSGSADVSARLALARGVEIPPGEVSSSTSGCKRQDFPKKVSGRIVLIQRGGCSFGDKARNAEAAGAVGAIIFAEGQAGDRETPSGSLGAPGVTIPVVGASFPVGRKLYSRLTSGAVVRMRIRVNAETEKVVSTNVIADLKGEVADRTVVVGAHLDSVPAGPGVNDNGSGTAAVLAIAERFAALRIKPRNTVRFAFWDAEEVGLVGSMRYVASLSPEDLGKIALNLNFDMVASPNFAALVYDGDGSEGEAGPPGSDVIEKVFVDHFRGRGLPTRPTLFDGRSDYLPFIQKGVPAGGLFSGAEEIKTKREAKLFGGEAGEPFDACYHGACDDIGNVSREALDQFGPAAAHAVYTFAQIEEDVRATARIARAAAATGIDAPYRGPKLVR